jgi:carbon starvation protein
MSELVSEPATPIEHALDKPTINAGTQTVVAYLLVATGSWATVWPLFGGAVQVFAGLTMFTLAMWLVTNTDFDHRLMFVGAAFVLCESVASLLYISGVNVRRTFFDSTWLTTATPIAAVSVFVQLLVVVVLTGIAVLLVVEGFDRLGIRRSGVAVSRDD